MSTAPFIPVPTQQPAPDTTASFAAIFARLDAHEQRLDALARLSSDQTESIDVLEERLERLESARIAAPVAPESAETAPGVPVEPGNATEAHSDARLLAWIPHRSERAEVAAALRMYRKVQGCSVAPNCGYGELQAPHVATPDGGCVETAVGFLAWLKEGEA